MVGMQECGARARAIGDTRFEYGSPAEAALLEAALSGDRAALGRLLGLYKQPLYVLCRGMLGHAEDADDAVGETFLRALRALPGFRGDAAVRTWLFRIAVNVCLEWKRARRPVEPWDEAHPATAAWRDHASQASPELAAMRRLRVIEALHALPPRHRAILLLKELEGWSVAEIGAALRWNENRVRNELSKARRALAEWRRREETEGDAR